MINNLTRQFSKIIYRLKRSHGFPVQITNEQTNLDILTGVKTTTLESKHIRRAVVLESKDARDFFFSGSKFPSSDVFRFTDRLVLIDFRDIEDFVLNLQSYVIIDDNRYTVISVTETIDDKCLMVSIRNTE